MRVLLIDEKGEKQGEMPIEAALDAAKISLQVHGALGYTWEQDLHVWMRRAWTLDLAWGETAWHRKRLADALFDDTLPVESFGFSPRSS